MVNVKSALITLMLTKSIIYLSCIVGLTGLMSIYVMSIIIASLIVTMTYLMIGFCSIDILVLILYACML